MKLSLLFIAILILLSVAIPAMAQEARPELRAFWADGFNPAFKSPQEIDQLLQRLHDAHFNAVFAQMRKGGDAYYASHYEPWAKDDTTHFDALACLIEKAHAMKPPIAVHAWINTCAVGGNGSNPFNIVHLHPDWLSLNPQNQNFDGEATKIDPGNPDAADWTFRLYLDVARHYDVDGIHFDFVRYGGREWGYNPVSVSRFQRQVGHRANIKHWKGTDLPDPTDPAWKQWRRDQVTNLVRKVYVHAAQIKPKLVISAAVIAWADSPQTEAEWGTKSAAMNRVYQDWRGWLQEGMIDLACPMTYFQSDYHPDWHAHWSEYIKNHQYGRAATVGVGTWFNTIPQSLEQIKVARQASHTGRHPYGVMLYSYSGTNADSIKDAKGKRKELTYQPDFYAALSSPFPTDVPLPPMPWKIQPKQGHLKGFALTANMEPIDGAMVAVRGKGKTYIRRTDGTGFYALTNLPPGDYAVSLTAPGYPPQQEKAAITAGQVTTVSFTGGDASVPLASSLSAVAKQSFDGTPVRLEKLRVLLGTDTFPGNLYVADAEGIGMRVRLRDLPLLPFQSGDIVSVTGATAHLNGEPVLDQAKACLTDLTIASMPVPKSVTTKELAAGALPRDRPVTVQGSITGIHAEGFALDCGGEEIQVALAGRKEFGVESTGLNMPPPVVGTQIAVTGYLSRGETTAKRPLLRLYPLDGAAIKRLPGIAFWQRPWALVILIVCVLALLAGWMIRHRKRRKAAEISSRP